MKKSTKLVETEFCFAPFAKAKYRSVCRKITPTGFILSTLIYFFIFRKKLFDVKLARRKEKAKRNELRCFLDKGAECAVVPKPNGKTAPKVAPLYGAIWAK
ncbi:MAG: hypothetical protein J6U60_02185 [Clostridia bacterium]|nr:hypothetical protein [Clostridia bacterium]